MIRHVLSRGLAGCVLLSMCCAAQAGVIGPSLQKRLAGADATARLEVIVTFRGSSPVGERQIAELQQIGVRGYRYDVLPMAGVLATPAQVRSLAALADVRSVWLNDVMQYDNNQTTLITGVQKVRESPTFTRRNGGLPVKGRGIGVLVNDSGIDATHEDLKLGENVVQNVIGFTDLGGTAQNDAGLEGIPHTPRAEFVPNSDIFLNSHGTHVAGIVGATGEMSGGKYAGVAPEANIIGHAGGISATLWNLIDGFDYALLRQSAYNIRVVTNSWGDTGQIGQPFNPDDPTNIATKRCADAGMVVVFSAGNSGLDGNNTITGNFKKAPWVVAVAAGSKSGGLADFSSRGKPGFGTQSITIDGQQYELTDRPTVVSPGFNVVSTRAKSVDPYVMGAGGTLYYDLVAPQLIEPALLPYYTTISGTSQAAPHVAGIIALLMQANPSLDWKQVKKILQATATSLPGLEDYEQGAGYVNAFDAVAYAFGLRKDYGSINRLLRSYNASIVKVGSGDESTPHDVLFSPVGDPANVDFDVGDDVVLVTASTDTLASTIGLSLIDPNGTRYSSSIAIGPSTLTVAAPAIPGHWRATLRGIGSVAGVVITPPVPGLPWNGYATPEPETVTVTLTRGAEVSTGLADIASHPLRGVIEAAIKHRLVDGRNTGLFEPDARLTRLEFAEYMTLGAGLRQSLQLNRQPKFSDLTSPFANAVAEAATARGAILKDLDLASKPPIVRGLATFDPGQRVPRVQMAVSLVRALGRAALADAFSGDVTAVVDGTSYPVTDVADVAPALRGYIQQALLMGLVQPTIVSEPDPSTGAPRDVAHFLPHAPVLRGEYAGTALAAEAAYGVNVDTSLQLPDTP